MNKKSLKALAVIAAMLFLPAALRAAGGQLLVLTLADQSVTKFALTDSPVVTYSGNDIVVTCGENVFQTSMADIRTVTFQDGEATAIEKVIAPEEKATYAFGSAAFEGLQAGSTVTVYTIDGKVVGTSKADADGRATADMTGLQSGIYIIRTANKSFKIKK